MAKTKYREVKGKRGVFGWLFLLLFIAFNLLMIVAVVVGLGGSAEVVGSAASGAEKAGATIGAGLGLGFLLTIWVIGDILLGIPVMLTRPSRMMVPLED